MKPFVFPVAMGIALAACGVSVMTQPIQFFVLMALAAAWGNWK